MGYKFLDRINSPKDLKKLNLNLLDVLCKEIREEIITTISETGGHIASSLGVVELTVALHKIFDCPNDKIIWDVGHQSYTHKLLTGRKKQFKSIRQENGLSGFPRQTESQYDAFIAGHSSTSISAACGISKAGEILNKSYYTIAIIGDGSLTGGLAYEGLNNAVRNGKEKLIVILNDNKMSISKNVGAMSRYLSKIRNAKAYFKLKDKVKEQVSKIPFVGNQIGQAIVKSKVIVKETLYHSNVFENFGFEYMGPVNGHDLSSLLNILTRAKQLSKPVFIHVKTTKGKGYKAAEKNPCKYHGISKQCNDADDNKKDPKTQFKDFSDVFGDEITKIAAKNDKVVAITAAMKSGTGLKKFHQQFPKRFFDVGIAEQHAVTFAAGLASSGCIPVFAVYSSFLQRSLDQIIHDAAIENQHIVLAIDRAGIVGEDGETHQGIFDVSFLSMIPNVTIFAPSNYNELRQHLNAAINQYDGIVAIRYPRGKEEQSINPKYIINDSKNYHIWHEKNNTTLIITYGRLFPIICELKESQTNISMLKLNKIWPIDIDVLKLISSFKKVIFVEETIKSGGIAEHLGIKLLELKFKGEYVIKAIENKFVAQASVEQALKNSGFCCSELSKLIYPLDT